MRPQAKWFRSATMMAFLALVALFVSPVLALACCCSAPSASSVVAASHQTAPAMPSCHGGAAHHPKAQVAESKSPANCAQVSAVCGCHSQNVDTALLASENGVFQFTPALVASEKAIFAAALAAQERPLYFICETARPRGPDRNLASGRAPPVLALS